MPAFLLICNYGFVNIKKHRHLPVFLMLFNNYLTVVVALRFHFHTSSPEP